MKSIINDMNVEKVNLEGAPPVIFIEVPKFKTENSKDRIY